MSDLIQSITASIIAVGGSVFLVGLLVCFCLYIDKDNKAKDEYVKNLNEHDKSVIAEYRSCGYHLEFKKKNKKSNIEKLIDEEINK